MNSPEIIIATSKDKANIIDTVALAFAADPFARWMYPDPNQYFSNIREMASLFAGKAFDHGTAYKLEAYRGTALWLPPDIHPDEEARVAHMSATIDESRQEAAFSVFEKMDNCHPSVPHWYLPIIAVDPHHQSEGCGAMLLAHANERFDIEAIPAYLESSNPKNITLYKRHGYDVITEIEAGLSVVTPMVRQPR